MEHIKESSEASDFEDGEFSEEDEVLERMYETFKRRKQLGWDASRQLEEKGKGKHRYKDVNVSAKYL